MDAQRESTLEKNLLYHVGSLSRSMVNHHMRHELAAFVLHELCSKNAFGLGKAAYFVNNPDFRCLKGVTGFHHNEAYKDISWDKPEEFIKHLEQGHFTIKFVSINQSI